MSARDGIDIPIKTTLDGRGLTQAEAAVKQVAQAVNPWVTATKSATAAQSQQETEVKAAARAIEQLGEKHETAAGKQEKVAGSSRNMGNAMLQASRAVDDAQYGISGVVNNLEGLALALGMGTGVAGAATVAAVALNTLIKNWDKLFAATENKPDWTALTPDQESIERMDRYNKQLERRVDLIERISAARVAEIEANQKQAEWEAKQEEKWKTLLPGQADKLPDLPGLGKPSAAMQKAVSERDVAQENAAQKTATALLLDREFKAQKKIVDDQSKRANLTRRFESNQGRDQSRLTDLNRSFGENGERGGTPEIQQEIVNLRNAIAARAKEFAQQTAGLARMGLVRALTGDKAGDEKTLQESLIQERLKLNDLEQRRYAAAQAAQQSIAPLNAAEAEVQRQAAGETDQATFEDFKALGLPPPPGVSNRADAAAGLPQNDASVVQSFAGRVSAGAEQNKALLEQATTKLEGLNTEGAKAMSTMATLITGLIENQRSLAAMLQSQSGDVSAVKQQLDSFRK